MDNVVIEELTLKPIGASKELGFKPLWITINGKPEPLVLNARDIADIKSVVPLLQVDPSRLPKIVRRDETAVSS
jgi:hypothetical protein